jgi:hypothetical protein
LFVLEYRGSEISRENLDLLKNVESLIETRLAKLVPTLGRRIGVAQLLVKSGVLRDLDVDKVIIGQTLIEKLILQGTTAVLHSANAFLQDVRINLELKISVEWFIDLEIFEDRGTEQLGSLSFNLPVGNIQIPSLSDINLTIPSVSVENISANVTPIVNLDLGGGQFEKLTATDTTVPSNGFQLNGIGLGNFTLSSLNLPATSTREAKLQRFIPNLSLLLPGTQINQLTVPNTNINNIQSQNIAFDGIATKRGIGVDLGFVGFTVFVQPIAHMFIGSMLFQNVNLSAIVNQARIENIHVPIDVRGITIKDIELIDVNVTDVSG